MNEPHGHPLTCPYCAAVLDVERGPAAREVACGACGGLLLIPAVQESTQSPDKLPEAEADRSAELSGLRIRQLAGARRAAYRSRSYCVIASIVCVVACVQLAWSGVRLLRAAGMGVRAGAYAAVTVLAAWGALYFFRKAMAFDREAKVSSLPQPEQAPDFAPLSDGSQQWKNLEEMR